MARWGSLALLGCLLAVVHVGSARRGGGGGSDMSQAGPTRRIGQKKGAPQPESAPEHAGDASVRDMRFWRRRRVEVLALKTYLEGEMHRRLTAPPAYTLAAARRGEDFAEAMSREVGGQTAAALLATAAAAAG
eukprot:Rhum_TRINITY_DN14427_c26_g1::Rhum_TRINITY_DN14427_c26_g1_i1::g.90020::m.90020